MNSVLSFRVVLQTLLSVVSLEGTQQEKRGSNLENYNVVSFSPEREWQNFCDQLRQYSEGNSRGGKQEQAQKTTDEDESWEYLLTSDFHASQFYNPNLAALQSSMEYGSKSIKSTSSPPAQNFLPKVLFSLHLLYENYKLNNLTKSNLRPLATLLSSLSIKLNWLSFVDHYTRDFGDITPTSLTSTSSAEEPVVPDLFTWISSALSSKEVHNFPILSNSHVCEFTRKICRLFAILRGKLGLFGYYISCTNSLTFGKV